MTAPPYVQARCELAIFHLQVHIEQLALRALQQLGLDATAAAQSLATAQAAMLRCAPRFVCMIEIHGVVWQDMYDDAPGHLFSSGAIQRRPAHMLTLTVAKTQAIELYEEARAAAGFDEGDGGQPYGFHPHGMVLRDQYGHALSRYQGDNVFASQPGWEHIDPKGEAQIENMRHQIKQLREEASTEAGWDNFETASGLRAFASRLEQEIEIANALTRAVI